MHETKIALTTEEQHFLHLMACQTGKTEQELIKEAVNKLISQFDTETLRPNLMAAGGIWKDREDLPDWRELRRSAERVFLEETP
jgi:hypothetical protein